MMDYTRQADIVDQRRLGATHVDLIGLGGIGSPTGLMLAKMGVGEMRVFDHDTVSPVNLPNQLYRIADAERGTPKAVACRQIWHEFADLEVEAIPARAEGQALRGIVVVGVDSMAAREAIWEEAIVDCPHVEWLIDARMGAESGTILTIRPTSPAEQRRYEKSLYADAEALDLPCTGRAILYNTLWIAALLGRQIKRIVMGESVERRIDFDLSGLTLVVE